MSFRLKGSPKRSTKLALQGVIEGGRLDGFRYTFERFSGVMQGGKATVRVHLIVSREHWPFPKSVVLSASEFLRLAPVAGERAKRIDALPLIRDVLQAAG